VQEPRHMLTGVMQHANAVNCYLHKKN